MKHSQRNQALGLLAFAVVASALILTTRDARAAGGDKTPVGKDGTEFFQGIWNVAKAFVNGMDFPDEVLKEVKVSVKGKDLAIVIQGAELKATLTVNAAKKPMEVDMNFEAGGGNPSFGIFEVQADSVKIYAAEVKDQRPKDFKTDAPLMILLKRPAGDKADVKDKDVKDKKDKRRAGSLVSLPNAEQGQTDKDKLKGTWTIVSGIKSGENLPPEMVGNILFVFEGEKLTVHLKEVPGKGPGSTKSGTFKLDEKAKPRSIDLTIDGETGPGIYEIDGDTLKLCFANPESKAARPTEFKAEAGTSYLNVVFRREKTEKKAPQPVANSPETGQGKSDRELVQGAWRPINLRLGNQKLPDEVKQLLDQIRIDVADGKISLALFELTMEGAFTLDSSKTPKQINLTIEDTKLEGVYELQGDKLRICGADPGKPRPTAVSDEADVVLEMTRINQDRRGVGPTPPAEQWLPRWISPDANSMTPPRTQGASRLLLPASEGESLRQPRQIQSPVPPQGDKQAKDAKQAKSDKELIQGEWMVESAIDDGAELPAEIREQVRFFVKGDSMTVKIVELEDKGTYTVQENKTPKTVDLKLESGTNLIGIYEFFGDKVKLCLVLEDKDTKRPTEFKSVGGSGHKLVVLARVKEEKKKDQVAGDTTYLFHQLFVERFVHVRPDAEFRVR